MSLLPQLLLLSALALALALSFAATPSRGMAEEARRAVWAGKFYPGAPAELEKMIAGFMDQAKLEPSLSKLPGLKAVVMPHAGYVYSGPVAAYAAKALEGRDYSRVILLGPDHRVGFKGCAITDKDAYATPLGTIPVDKAAAGLLKQDLFTTVAASDQTEHSLEVLLPFLQVSLKKFTLIPITVSMVDPDALAKALAPLLDDSTLLAVSTDLSHYLPYDQAVSRDRETLQLVNAFDFSALEGRENAACGITPLLTLMRLAKERGWEPVTLKYLNSGDTAGDKDRVVGYGAMAWFATQEGDRTKISDADGQQLIQIARTAIRSYLENRKVEPADSDSGSPRLMEKGGTFVTITKNGSLRGCIGDLNASEPLATSVRDNAIRAAFSDPRFPPLSVTEVKDITIEVSVLTAPQPLEYQGADDLLSKLRPGVDGVIIKQGFRKATFLPQVWEQLPDPREFLNHLCAKAGMAPEAWTKGTLDVLTYQVQAFHEGK